MKILLTNDDGYRAQGLVTLGRELIARGHEVTVFAPDKERSGASHSFTITNPLKPRAFEENGLKGYMVDGTPADCARLGLYMMENKVDMTISGINNGANMGGACVYSGTVGAAMEASMCGCPALAASLASFRYDFTATAKITVKVMEWALKHPLPMGCIYNLNVPPLPYEEIKGIKSASLAPIFLGEARYEKRTAPYHFDYYWLTDGANVPITDPQGDKLLAEAGWATLSPLTWNIIHPDGMDEIDIKL